ncbi:MAG: NAD(P)H-dependent oxidoreductase [Methylocella sp.]
MHLLHVEGSPRKQRSASIEVARSFIDTWRARHREATVDTLDVWTTDLPPFDGPALDAKYAGLAGQARTDEQERVWSEINRLAERFRRADILLFSVPMWNFGIPYRLKHLIDAVSQKDVLFTFDERGLLGLLSGRKAVTIAARGVGLEEGFPAADFDFQTTYMRMWCRMVGVADLHTITVEKTLFGPEADLPSRTKAKADAAELASAI